MSQDKEREAFEAWAKTRGYNTRLSEYGHYPSLLTALTHEGWQARAALASQQAVKGEPVAWDVKIGDRWVRCSEFEAREYASENGAETRRLYASPPSREPLTDEQIRAEWLAAGGGIHGPNVETVNMPESRYFKFRRGIHSREGGSNG